jgi:triphosphatase
LFNAEVLFAAMATETELKLAVDPDSAASLDLQPVVANHAVGAPRTRPLTNIYFDTPDMELQSKGVALRLRHQGERWLQTLKTAGRADVGLHRRGEWEVEVPGEALDLDRFEDPELRGMFSDQALRERLRPLFGTDFQRTAWNLEFPDGSRVELARDHGEVRAGDTAEPIDEIELELQQGAPARLFEVARSLAEALPMRLLNISKAERGYHLVVPPPPPAGRKADSLGLAPGMSSEQALQSILRHVLRHLEDNEPVVLDNPDDIEGVHQMRVATRRMRSCLNVFRPLIPKEVSGQLDRRIKWLTDALGPARDWDVFIAETLQPLTTHFSEHGGLAELLAAAKVRREEAYRHAQAEIRSPEYTRLLLGIGAWIERRDWREVVGPERLAMLDGSVRSFAAKVMAKRHRQVRKRGDQFARLTIDERHELRILCKKLRYATEFFAELWGRKVAKPYIRSLSRLQDTLGVLNDAAVAHQLIEQLGAAARAGGADLVYGWTAATSECHLSELDAAWHAFSRRHEFWKAG